MKTIMQYIIIGLIVAGLFSACGSAGNEEVTTASQAAPAKQAEGVVTMTPMQRQAVTLELGKLKLKNLSTSVKATGELEVPPQNEANVSAMVGGNVYQIKVVEGDKIRKGQTLALLEHPDLIQMQTDLQEASGRLEYLQQEYQRQQRLYEQKVGSGKVFQEAKANYTATRARVEGLKSKLSILNLNTKKILEGKIYRYIPVVSPIGGYLKNVNINIGEYVPPQKMMFGIVDNSHIHADLMVFENDVYKVKEGQKVSFTVANTNREYTGKIYAVGKTFEENPKAVHVHAEIEERTESLIPGMYIEGRIAVDDMATLALPEAAIVGEGEDSYIFVKTGEARHDEEKKGKSDPMERKAAPVKHSSSEKNWTFKQVPVITGAQDNGWIEVRFLNPLPDSAQVAFNGAYHLLAEMKKGETEHGH